MTIRAAGGVVVRDGRVLLIHRERYDDWSLPKGKLEDVENSFAVPVLGSRAMLRSEERSAQKDYYWLLEQAGIPFPKKVASPDDIDRLVIVKLHHAQKKLERGFTQFESQQ